VISDNFFAILQSNACLAEREGIYKGFPDGEVLLQGLLKLKWPRLLNR